MVEPADEQPRPARQSRDIRSAFCWGHEKGHSPGVALLLRFLWWREENLNLRPSSYVTCFEGL